MTEGTIINKMTFYDIVTLIVPSALVCYDYNWKPLGEIGSWEGYIAQFGVLLMVGLLLKSIGVLWSNFWFRNNTDIILEEKAKATNIGGENISCGFIDIIFADPMKFILGPIMKCFYKQDNDIIRLYYNQYEIAYAQAYYGKRIEILESHVAFLQTWIIALVVLCFEKPEYLCCIVMACYVSIIIMLSVQRKIYNMIWETPNKISNDGTKE